MKKQKDNTAKSFAKARREAELAQGDGYNRTREKIFKPKNSPKKDRKRWRQNKDRYT
jgi:hypothetical protein